MPGRFAILVVEKRDAGSQEGTEKEKGTVEGEDSTSALWTLKHMMLLLPQRGVLWGNAFLCIATRDFTWTQFGFRAHVSTVPRSGKALL